MVFPKEDITQGLGRINIRGVCQWSQTSQTDIGNEYPSCAIVKEECVSAPPPYGSIPKRRHAKFPPAQPQEGGQQIGRDTSFVVAATQVVSFPTPGVDMPGPVTPPNEGEEDKWFVLVVTASLKKLNIEMADADPEGPVTT